jgi:hypothetical protein
MRLSFIPLGLIAALAMAQAYLPDANRTPGYVDQSATLDKICGTPNYSRTVRPPMGYTSPIKKALLDGRDVSGILSSVALVISRMWAMSATVAFFAPRAALICFLLLAWRRLHF